MINALFAVDSNGGMGYNGSLPWPHNREDMLNFKQLTNGHVVVMGRNSWDDPKMPKPLKGRIVYVASNRHVNYAGAIKGDLKSEIRLLKSKHPDQTIWIVGGPAILEECKELYDKIYLTYFKNSYKVDTKINIKTFLSGFSPVKATVAKDFQSTCIVYEPIFKLSQSST